LERALWEISKAVRSARRDASIRGAELEFVCFGLAGMDSPLDARRIERGLRSLRLARRQKVVHDTIIALTGALGGEAGVAVIAGTGSVAGGVDSNGRMVRVGGWGAIIDDEGSAYDIGRKALTSALRMYDGRGKPTALLKAVMKRIGTRIPEGIIEAVYIKGMGVAGIASLSPVVVELGLRGDPVAYEILKAAGDSLAELALAAANKLGLNGRFKIAPVGGVFRSGGLVIDAFKAKLRKSAPSARVVPPKFPPVVGSLVLSLREGGVRVSRPILTRLAGQLRGRSKIPP
jgi:N-acetylglucosamine kinase-like BadF-type ATPase